MKTVGFIDYYLDEFHANHYPQWLKEASGGELEVKYAYGKITSPLTGMTSAQWCQKYGVELVESVEELIAKSDCLNVLSPDNPEMHGELCQLPLRSGKRVYVDKTFSNSRQEAQALFALAEDHGTPCFSASALRFAQELEGVDREQLAGLVHINKYYLSPAFRKEFNTSPISYLISRRIQESRFLLAETDHSLSQIAQILGFSSSSYFSQSFRRLEGMSPMEYRKRRRSGG